MKKYSLVYFVCGILVAGGVFIYNQKDPLVSSVGKKSVEFDIAELSPAGETAGYAMPASGGSPPSTVPGCAIVNNPDVTTTNSQFSISWVHGTIPSASVALDAFGVQNVFAFNSFMSPVSSGLVSVLGFPFAFAGGSPPPPPVPPDVAGILDGLGRWRVAQACIAYCDLDAGTCDQNDDTQWTIMNISSNTSGPFTFSDSQIVYAGSGGGGTCENANAVSNNFLWIPPHSGNFAIGIKAGYVATYGGHHTVTAENSCSTIITANGPGEPELIVQTNIDGKKYTYGEDVVLLATLLNQGTGATDRLVGEDGMFNYVMEIDVNNNGFTNGVGGDITLSTGDIFGPLARKNNISSPHSVEVTPTWTKGNAVLGTHGYSICVDTNNRVTEIQEGNNCTSGTFSVVAPDVEAGTLNPYYAVYGQPLELVGSVRNISDVDINTAFSNEIGIQTPGGGTQVTTPATSIATLVRGGGSLVTGQAVDHIAVFGTTRSLQYRVSADSADVLTEVSEANNITPWANITLEYPEVRPVPVDINGATAGYWGPFVFESNTPVQPVFDIRNETPQGLAIATTFNSVMAVDIDGDCTDGATKDDACIDYTTTVSTAGIAGNDASRKRPSWTPARIGTYRARLYADTDNVLPEGNKVNNTTPWVTFEVIDALPGQAVTLTADPSIVRKGQSTTLSWNIGGHTTASCQILKNNTNDVVTTIGATTGTYTVTPSVTTEYLLQCSGDGTYSPASSRITVQVLPVLYES